MVKKLRLAHDRASGWRRSGIFLQKHPSPVERVLCQATHAHNFLRERRRNNGWLDPDLESRLFPLADEATIRRIFQKELNEKGGEAVAEFTHFDESGASRMVDVTPKEVTLRTARASGRVRVQPSTLALIVGRGMAKGDVLEVARLAGIMAAKRTGELIPLCHPLGLDSVEVAVIPVEPDSIMIQANVKIHGRTGVEMEALVAVSVAALTVYDMCKSVDRGMVIDQIQLEEKVGGRRGLYRRPGPPS